MCDPELDGLWQNAGKIDMAICSKNGVKYCTAHWSCGQCTVAIFTGNHHHTHLDAVVDLMYKVEEHVASHDEAQTPTDEAAH
jgi:hypothetical protein